MPPSDGQRAGSPDKPVRLDMGRKGRLTLSAGGRYTLPYAPVTHLVGQLGAAWPSSSLLWGQGLNMQGYSLGTGKARTRHRSRPILPKNVHGVDTLVTAFSLLITCCNSNSGRFECVV